MANARDKKKRGTDRRNVWLLVLTTLLVLGSVFMFTPPQEKINQGLDIQGGLSVVLTAHNTEGGDVSSEDMEASRLATTLVLCIASGMVGGMAG